MLSKKYFLLAALMLFMVSGAWAQLGGTHNYMDSSFVPAKRMAQQNEWKNNSKNQNFPAKPSSMWQLGITGGLLMVDGDIGPASLFPGWNIGIQARKALGYVLSMRGSLTYGQTKGLDYRKNTNLSNNPALAPLRPTTVAAIPNAYYVPNFQMTEINPSLDVLISLNNIMFHSKQSKVNVYALVGYSPTIYKTAVDLKNSAGAFYNFSGVNFNQKRKDIRSQLNDILDGDYETPALLKYRAQNFNQSGLGKYNFRHGGNLGLGAELRLSPKTSLGLEVKYTFTHDDYFDGAPFQGENFSALPGGVVLTNTPVYSPTSDNVVHTNLSFNINLGDPKKKAAPLWWLNPLDFAYGELNNPVHTKFPKQVLPDADDDGVTDQFDVEPNTPAGCPVDAKGKSRDTDGDGVPDCRDKELITPTACQPVNADGVGKCPDPQCCADIRNDMGKVTGKAGCSVGDLPSIAFKGSSVAISSDAAAILAAAASKIKASPECKICVVGHGTADKRAQQLSWDRANAVKKYLVEKLGIGEDRFGFKYGEEGDANTVDLMDCTGDETPNSVPAPHPNLQKTK